jgi:iron complex outermembrane receptor protein
MKSISGILNQQANRVAATRSLLAVLAASTACVSLASAQAQTTSGSGVETIVVTAEKRSENIQNVPMSVSAVSGAQLEQLGITDIQTIAPFLPNFAVNNVQKNRNASVEIRNFGSSNSNPGIENDVGVYIDGLYQPAGGGTSLENLTDISDIEVLRGPQGTLYGRNTVAGALIVTTRAPTQTEEAMVDVTYGNFGYQRVQGYFGGGITNDLAGRVTLYASNGNDWEHDITTGSWIGGSSEYGGRLRFAYTPNADLTVNFIGSYDRISSTFGDWVVMPSSLTGPYSILTPNFLSSQAAVGQPFRAPNENNREVTTLLTPNDLTQTGEAEVNAEYALPYGDTLTSVSGFNAYIDTDISPGGSLANDEGTQLQSLDSDSYSEELRLASKTGGFIEYLAGLYGYYQTFEYTNWSVFGPGDNILTAGGTPKYLPGTGSATYGKQRTDSGAIFGQVTINPIEHLHIIGGGRLSYTDKTGDLRGDTINQAPHNTDTGQLKYSRSVATWLATVQYDVSQDVMVYALASTGFKDGGFNMQNIVVGVPAFRPETSTDQEVGVKTKLFDDKVVFDFDVYQMKIYAYQQSAWDGGLIPPGFIVGNAGNLLTRGYEATLEAKPIDPLTINGSIGLAAEKISDYSDGTCPSYPGTLLQPRNTGPANSSTPAGTCNYDGLTPSFAPRMRWSIAATWEQPLTMLSGWDWFAESDFSWTGSNYIDTTLDPPSFQGPVKILNARLGIESESGKWRIMLWGKNLTDQLYYTFVTNMVTQAEMQGATPQTTPGGYSGLYAPPRTFGAEASYRF